MKVKKELCGTDGGKEVGKCPEGDDASGFEERTVSLGPVGRSGQARSGPGFSTRSATLPLALAF